MGAIVVVIESRDLREQVCRALLDAQHAVSTGAGWNDLADSSRSADGIVCTKQGPGSLGSEAVAALRRIQARRPDIFVLAIDLSQNSLLKTHNFISRTGPCSSSWADSVTRRVVSVASLQDLAPVIEYAISHQSRKALLREELDRWHERLLARSAEAPTQIFSLIVPELRRRLRQRRPSESSEVVDTAIDDALTMYFLDATRYNPARGHLLEWLFAIAWNKVKDEGRVRRRRAAREVSTGLDVSAVAPDGSLLLDLHTVDTWVTGHRERLLTLARTQPERAFLERRLHGCPISEQAAALGVSDRPLAEQRRVVNRVWNAIHQRLKRTLAPKVESEKS